MFRVYESRENIPTSDVADSLITGSRLDQEVPWSCLNVSPSDQCCYYVCMLQVCVAAGTHQALVASLATALLLLLATAAWAGVVYRKTRALALKNRSVSSSYL